VRIDTAFVAAVIALVSPPALAQANVNDKNRALTDCVEAANQKYKDTWDSLCLRIGKNERCIEFVGSPRDKEFSELRIEELTLCSKLYK
jgi:hypothetical protein